jgi:alpha-tubulin suppressor-like RCC1 family protein
MRKVVPGGKHTCSLVDDGSVVCFGDNQFGQLGIGWGPDVAIDAPLTPVNFGGKKATDIAAGTAHTCALLEDQTVQCWGLATNSYAISWSSDSPQYDSHSTPQPLFLGAGRTAKRLAVGEDTTCIVKDNDQVFCSSGNFELYHAIVVPAGRQIESLAVNDEHRCVILDNGDATCSGSNRWGELGMGNTTSIDDITPSYQRIDLGTGLHAAQMAIGKQHICAIVDSPGTPSRVKCWGGDVNVGTFDVLGTTERRTRGDEPGEMGNGLPFSDLTF